MSHEITYLEDERTIFTLYTPEVDIAELQGVVLENLELAQKTGALLFLGDCRQLANSGSLFDVYALGDALERTHIDGRMREALVVTPEPSHKGTFDFFVTVTTNRGLQVRLFAEIDEAKAWLREEGLRLGLLPAPGSSPE